MQGLSLTEENHDPLTISHFNDGEPVKCKIIHWWVQQYCLAGMMEVSELIQSETDQNSIIEVIDIFHFVMSIMQCCGCTYDDIAQILEKRVDRTKEEDWDSIWHGSETSGEVAIFVQLSKIIDLLPWKHWSKKTEFDAKDIKLASCELLLMWCGMARDVYGLNPERVHSVYVQKNEVNISRQLSGTYGLEKKDESDNQQIDVQ